MTTHYRILDKYLIARAAGAELGAQFADGDTLDLRECVVVTTDFVAGLAATTDKQLTVLVSSSIQLDLFTMARKLYAGWPIRIEALGDTRYRYFGDKLTADALRVVECRAVMRVNTSGKFVCTRGKNGSMLVETDDGQRHVVIGRLLRKVKEVG